MKRWSGLFFFLIVAVGCEKNIDFQPIAQTPLLVVDGTIESGQPPQIILTSSLNYFTNINPQLLAGSFVHNAKITMTDGTRTHDLKEYEINASNGYKFYFYHLQVK